MKKVKWGVIGAGGIADKRTMPGILRSELGELVAFAEVVPERREELKEKYGVTAYADAESLLADERVECVYIASPLHFHREQAEMALKAGKHILLEKPLGVNAAQAAEIAHMAAESGLQAAAGFMMRFHAIHVRMREMVQRGELGRMVFARAQFGGWSIETGKKWRHVKALGGGGSLMDCGIHAIDLLDYILGKKTVSVAAMNATLAHGFDVEDTSCVMLRYEDGQPALVDSYFSMPCGISRIELCGTRGILIAEDTLSQVEEGIIKALPNETLSDAEKEEFIRHATDYSLPADGSYSMYSSEVDALCRSILEGAPVAIPLDGAAQVQRVVEAAYRSGDADLFIKL